MTSTVIKKKENHISYYIENLLKKANKNHKPEHIEFLTDGRTENVNHTVSSFIKINEIPIEHLIAQKDRQPLFPF